MVNSYYIVLGTVESPTQDQEGLWCSAPLYGNKDFPIASIKQGNKLGPPLWALIRIIKMYKTKGHSMTISAAISNQGIPLFKFAFVDHTELVSVANNALVPQVE